MKKIRILSVALAACLAVAAVIFCLPAEVRAETQGIYTYTVTDGKATVTGCQTSASGHIAVPERLGGYPVTTIGAGAFKDCNKLEVITFSEGITTIEANAFQNCVKLTKLNIPNSIASIASSAFSGCDSLTYNIYDNGKYLGNDGERYIVLMDTVSTDITACQIHEGTKVIFYNAFFDCGLTSITIPHGVRTIGEKAFFQCTRLKNVTIPNSVTAIHSMAFGNCRSLAGITIPGGVTEIGDKVFSQCKSLTAVTVPEGVRAIGKSAFAYCNYLTDIVLPKSLTAIGEGAFLGCSGLKNVYYKGTEAEWALIAGTDALPNAAVFYNASGCIHKWDEGAVTKEANCVEPGTKTYTCTLCQEKREEELPILTTHTYQNDCDTDCDICGLLRETTHSYDPIWHADETGHFYECTVCGDKKDENAHTPGPEATDTTPQTCTVCGYIVKPALGHIHNFGTEWKADSTGHWHGCDGCEEKGESAAHSFENDCDADCTVCGYVRAVTHSYKTEWSSDGEKHWHECSICGDKKDENAHIPGAEPTENAPQTCTACGYVLAPATGTPDPTEPPTEPNPGAEEGGDLWVKIFVAVAVIAAAALGVTEVVFRRKKSK
ncbi:MAG: leucine-rich repeat domain-containing protein [Oscillospiraceae bacterium]|nr:leucine-rich repeat domain-containing protein [Oscillospiraceae bacterium]